MQLETKHYYDDETLEFVASRFFIDGEEVKFEDYQYFIKGLEEQNNKYEEKTEENPYEYVDEDEVCECDECKYKDKKKYESCDNDCKYMNCDECCNDFCDCENEGCEDCSNEYESCKDCKDDEFDYGDLLEVFTCRIMEADKDYKLVKEILDEFADIFIPDYDEDEFEIECENECDCMIEECNCENVELTDERIEEIKLIEVVANKIENIQCTCGYELRDALFWLYSTGKSIGWNDHCCFIQKLMDDEKYKDYKENKESKKDKYNITCNLTVNNTKEDINKATEQIFNMINNAIRCG